MGMDALGEARQALESLLSRIQAPPHWLEEHFGDARIERVAVRRSSRRWTIAIHKETLLPRDVDEAFCALARERLASVADVEIAFTFGEAAAAEDLLREYWPCFAAWAQREIASVNGWLAKARAEASGDLLTLYLPDATVLQLARKRSVDELAVRFFRQRFGCVCRIRLAVDGNGQDAYEELASRIREEEREEVLRIVTVAKEEAVAAEADGPQPIRLGAEIPDEPVPLSSITGEEKRVTVQGEVFGLEARETRSGSTLYQFYLTDRTDSILVKVFGKTKDENRTLSGLAEGKWLKLRGRVELDRYLNPPEPVLMPADIRETAAPERVDDAEEKRVEFHLHTTM